MEAQLLNRALTSATKELQSAPQTTPKLPSASWNAKWLKLSHVEKYQALAMLEREVGRFCADIWKSPTEGRLLVLAGSNGCGKTMMAKAVRRWIGVVGSSKQFMRSGFITHIKCDFWRWPELIDLLKSGGWEVVQDLIESCVLIIDDLGAEHDPSSVGVDKLCQILSRRENKHTMITTNIVPAAWQDKFDRRVASRLYRNSTLVDLSSVPDYCV